MGLVVWLAGGIVAAALARIVPRGRTRAWLGETAAAVVTAILLGLLATALDFGGWREPDWRAGLFAFFGALAAAGSARAVRR
jgi:uncharacterized membrane protein YeaQ/YmgE (transglycosylase-associated protein family)